MCNIFYTEPRKKYIYQSKFELKTYKNPWINFRCAFLLLKTWIVVWYINCTLCFLLASPHFLQYLNYYCLIGFRWRAIFFLNTLTLFNIIVEAQKEETKTKWACDVVVLFHYILIQQTLHTLIDLSGHRRLKYAYLLQKIVYGEKSIVQSNKVLQVVTKCRNGIL